MDIDRERDRLYMQMAIDVSRRSQFEDSKPRPYVGVVVVLPTGEVVTACRGELRPGQHAEYTALEEKLATEVVAGSTVYTTLEPCTSRNHPKIACAMRLAERKVRRVVIGMLDPNHRICGRGVRYLRSAGIDTELFLPELVPAIEDLNRAFIRAHEATGAEGQHTREGRASRRVPSPPRKSAVEHALLDGPSRQVLYLLALRTRPFFEDEPEYASSSLPVGLEYDEVVDHLREVDLAVKSESVYRLLNRLVVEGVLLVRYEGGDGQEEELRVWVALPHDLRERLRRG